MYVQYSQRQLGYPFINDSTIETSILCRELPIARAGCSTLRPSSGCPKGDVLVIRLHGPEWLASRDISVCAHAWRHDSVLQTYHSHLLISGAGDPDHGSPWGCSSLITVLPIIYSDIVTYSDEIVLSCFIMLYHVLSFIQIYSQYITIIPILLYPHLWW